MAFRKDSKRLSPLPVYPTLLGIAPEIECNRKKKGDPVRDRPFSLVREDAYAPIAAWSLRKRRLAR